MYQFKDITDHSTPISILPSEAVMINGVYLENVIDGYRTLYVKWNLGRLVQVMVHT